MNVELIEAGRELKPVVLNLGLYYLYDHSEALGFRCPEDGLFRTDVFEKYWAEADRRAFLVRVDGELAGFALVGPDGTQPRSQYDVGEFFILRKFRRRGVGRRAAFELFDRLPGRWEVRVLVDNAAALAFWRAVLDRYTGGAFTELPEPVQCGPWRDIVLTFDNTGGRDRGEPAVPAAHEAALAAADATSDVRVRATGEADLVAVAALCGQWAAEGLTRGYGADTAEQLHERLGDCFLVAERDSAVVGFAIGQIRPTAGNEFVEGVLDDEPRYLEVQDLYVEAPSRGRGIGTRLVRRLLEIAAANGVSGSLVYSANHDYARTARFYETCGYRMWHIHMTRGGRP